jgi:hypothetical protein
MNSDPYDEDYYIHGRESGKSLYQDYRWVPGLTIPMAVTMINHLGIKKSHTILDHGCARGYTVKAMRCMGYLAFGVDTSKWAMENCDEAVRDWVRPEWKVPVDWIISKDTLEHVPQVADEIDRLMSLARYGVFAVVPLSGLDGQPYIVSEYEKDTTHIHRLTLGTWARYFIRPGWTVTASYRVEGIKDNYFAADMHPHHFPEWEHGNGFLTAIRNDK